jgi:hypothetical protein
MGMEVFLCPAYLGYDDGGSHEEGWYTEVIANGPSKMYQYGKYLGQRYKNFENIIWVMGGDCAPGDALDEIREMVRGIEEAAGPQLFTVHNGRFQSGLTAYPGDKWIDLNSTYCSESTSALYLKSDFQRNHPFYYIEGTYENSGATSRQLRGQMFLPVLMGGNGSFFGNFPLFNFNEGWENSNILDSQGARDLQRAGEFFRSRAWNTLVPDMYHTILTGGYGDLNNSSYAATAITKDGNTAIIYVPDYRELTINLTLVSGTQSHGWWYQPSTGVVHDLGLISDSPSRSFVPPDSGDWLLVLDNAAVGLASPGKAG